MIIFFDILMMMNSMNYINIKSKNNNIIHMYNYKYTYVDEFIFYFTLNYLHALLLLFINHLEKKMKKLTDQDIYPLLYNYIGA